MGILVIGAVFVDIKGYPLDKYIPGGRNVGRVIHTHGGVCRNVVENIANVELRPAFLSVVDDTGIGAEVVDRLSRHKVNTDCILRQPDGMGTWLAIIDNSGDVVAYISRRPDLSALLDVLNARGDSLVSRADSIVVEIDMDAPILKRVFALAQQYGKDVYGVVSNMAIAMERRDLLQQTSCIVCNKQEAGMLFSEDYSEASAEEISALLPDRLARANIPRMVVTLGSDGAVYAEQGKGSGICTTPNVDPVDTTGCGDAFFSGVAIGLTYGKTLPEACEIGTRLAISVILTKESVCPRFRPEEFGLSPVQEE